MTMHLTLARLPWAAQAAVALGVSAACAACFHLFWAIPARENRSAQERALAAARHEFAAAVTAGRKLPDARRAVAALRVRLEALRGVAPGEADAPAVLRDVQALAEESGLWITSFKPTPPVVRDSIAEWSVALEFDGTYAAVVAFLQRLADEPRLLTVSALRLRAHQRPEDESTVTGGCRLTTFVPRELLAAAVENAGTPPKGRPASMSELATGEGLP